MCLLVYLQAIGQREWKYPSSTEKVFMSGETIRFWYDNDGQNERKHIVKIYHTGGTVHPEGGTPYVLSAQQEVYTRTFYSGCKGYPVVYFDWYSPCNRAGTFVIEVETKVKGGLVSPCKYKDDGRSSLPFTLIKEIDTPHTPDVHFACVNKPYTITLNNPNNEYNNAYWYDMSDPTNLVLINEGFSYTKTYGSLETALLDVYYTKNMGHCEAYSNFGKKITVLGANVDPLLPPQTQFRTLCEPQEYTLQLSNPFNYDNVNWYQEFDDPVPFHNGFVYTDYFSALNEVLYVSYTRNNGQCSHESERMPIHVTVLPSNNIALFNPNIPSVSSINIYDHRDVQRDCFSDPEFYHDLNSDNAGGNETEQVTSLVDFIAQRINDVSPFTSFEITDYGSLEWMPNTNGEDYYKYGDELRVCADNITDEQGVYNTKEYTLNTTIAYIISAYDIDGNKIYEDPRNCTLEGLRTKRISNRPPGSSNPTEKCVPPGVEQVRSLIGESNVTENPCTTAEVKQTCPHSTYTLGPLNTVDIPFSTYSWFPTTGLSDPTIKNPTIRYEDIPVDEFQIMKYTLTISHPSATTTDEKHCVYLYKCKNCGPLDNDILNTGNL